MRLRIQLALALASTSLLFGCIFPLDATKQTPLRSSQGNEAVKKYQIESNEFLPYGKPISAKEALSQPPRPYAPGSGLRVIPPTQSAITKRLPIPPAPGLERRLKNHSGMPTPGDGDAGFWITAANKGIYFANDVQDDLSFPSGWSSRLVYSPTHKTQNAAFEATTIHYHPDYGLPTYHNFGIWDWRPGGTGWVVYQEMDSNWKGKYVRNFGGEPVFFGEIYNTTGTSWTAVIYNFNSGMWETLANSTVNGTDDRGWTMWESYDFGYTCPSLPNIRAGGLRLLDNANNWNLLAPNQTASLGPYGECWTGWPIDEYGDQPPFYNFHVNSANSDWEAYTRY